MLTAERKKKLDIDLWIIFLISAVVLGLYSVLGNHIVQVINDSSINIVLRVLFVGGIFQFGLAGLGITIVAILRKERFSDYGLNRKSLIKTLFLSMCCCIPDFIYNFFAGNMHPWMPFSDVHTTAEALRATFPYNVLAMLITAIYWGFFEGFNYVVVCKKISERYASKRKLWAWGAFVCAVMCILVHGIIGVTPDAILEMVCTMILIYGMLIVYKITGNAWGSVLIFMIYWNAL